jgi:uroporphyrinogen decarboxylase
MTMPTELSPRERVLTAMRREEPDKVPKFADFSPGIYRTFLEKAGYDPHDIDVTEHKGRPGITYRGLNTLPGPAEYFGYDVRIIEFGETKQQNDFSAYLQADLPVGRSRIGEWGIAYVRGSEHHFESMVHPLAGTRTIEDLEAYPWPDVTADYRRQIALQSIQEVHSLGYASVGWPPLKGGTLFETAWGLRGFEALLMDMMVTPDFASTLLDKVAELSFSNYYFLARCGVDIVMLGDDVGMQDRMIISPDMWRQWFKPRYAELISNLKSINPQVLIFYHSDGNIEAIIPELIEIGIEILNPVQPECMDPALIKKKYGDRLAFWGTIGTQTTLPFGTPEEVRAVVKERINTVGRGGGLLLAPTHKIEPDVPWENVIAFFEAVEEYGSYR